MVKSKKSSPAKKRKSSSPRKPGARKNTTPGKPTGQHMAHAFLCRNGSGSFTLGHAVSCMEQTRADIGIETTRPKTTRNCYEGTIYSFEHNGKLVTRPFVDGEPKFKPAPLVATAVKEIRRTLPPDAHPTLLGQAMVKRVGAAKSPTKNQLFLERIRARDARPSMPGTPSNGERGASLAPTDISDVVMEELDDSMDFAPDDFVPSEGPSRPQPTAPPRTPVRLQATLSYLSPPQTTAQLPREASHARFPQPDFTAGDDLPFGGAGISPAETADKGPSDLAASSSWGPSTASGRTAIEALANDAKKLVDRICEEAQRSNAALQERDVRLQQQGVQLREKHAELQATNAALAAHRERSERLKDHLDEVIVAQRLQEPSTLPEQRVRAA
ncbi:hypothetical protein BD310DRAFT_321725 [Dichomitus squalens]|uniref:Uncharacterized protein n=1 Tax=Dichomitus squalens TaxID=114155 RepID=A0A4Q9Q087_9APHY|nr:hypothetical protein BD310DRAFT_321725 [Dichomitus squalens]